MIKALYLILFLFLIKIYFAQSPGGVSAGLRAWYKADANVYNNAGTTLASDGNLVQQWNDKTANVLHLSQATAANKPTFKNGSLGLTNYNPYLVFSNSDLDRAAPGLFISATTYSQVNFYVPFIDDDNSDFDWLFYQGTSGFDRFSYSFNFGGGTPADIDLTTSNRISYGHTTLFGANKSHLTAYKANTNGIHNTGVNPKQSFYIDGSLVTTSNAFTPFVGTNNPFNLGDNESSAVDASNSPFTGKIPEYILYLGSLTQAEHERIESYLAIKYGITLTHNYLSGGGSTIYNVANTYSNSIIGLAKETALSGINQKQSHSTDDSVRIYVGNLVTTNAANAGSISNNNSYIVMGTDKGKWCATAASNAEKPACVQTRIAREWRIQTTNFQQTFNLDIRLNNCAATNSVNVADLRLLVDDDGNFAGGGTTCLADGQVIGGVTFRIFYSAGVVTFSNMNTNTGPFTDNGFQYLTLASTNSLTPLPIELVSFTSECDNTDNSTLLKWTTFTETNNAYFEIEKSEDATTWQTIATINGAGNSSVVKNYYYKDFNRFPQSDDGLSYYHLKQVDADGMQTIASSIIYMEHSCQSFAPNPASDKIYIKDFERFKSFEILNQLGQIIKSGEVTSSIITLNNIVDGMYHIRLIGINEKVISKKIQINKK